MVWKTPWRVQQSKWALKGVKMWPCWTKKAKIEERGKQSRSKNTEMAKTRCFLEELSSEFGWRL